MKIYPSLFAYLSESETVTPDTLLLARYRPIIVLEIGEDISPVSCLIPMTERVYEIAFPYIKPTDIGHKSELEYGFNLVVSGENYALRISDEVLDLETIQVENELAEWERQLGERLDTTTSGLIRLFVGMFTKLFAGQKSNLLVSLLPQKLAEVNADEANIPIVISLERKYELRRKLQAISSKLRHQLRRQAELMSVGKIQEMDSYCLRDYVRRPGLNAVEKAGVKQELMGIQRYQDFNTLENKFLVYFSQILHLNCYRYERSGDQQYKPEIQQIRLVIDLFKQQPVVKSIQDSKYQFTRPNYILQQNYTYRSFYQAYLEYISKRYEKERLWAFRNYLLADTVYICLTAALLKFTGVYIDATLNIIGRITPDQGRYIQPNTLTQVKIFLQNQVYIFALSKPEHHMSDWLLSLEIHQLNSKVLETQKIYFPIWVFWYCPDEQVITQIQKYLQNFPMGLIFYLQLPPHQCSVTGNITSNCEDKLQLVQLPDPTQGFSQTVTFMSDMLREIVDLFV